MKKVLIVCPYPHGKAPSQRFRFEQYLDLVQADFDIHSFWKEDEWPRIYQDGSMTYKVVRTIGGFGRRLRLLFQVRQYDKVFIHREATPIGLPWFEWAVAKVFRKPIIFDFDDAIWLPNSSKANEKLAGKLKFHGKTAKICSWATTCSVGNSFLADYAKQYCHDVRIIPTTIDTENHHNPDLYVRRGSKWVKKSEAVVADKKSTEVKVATSGKRQADHLESDNLVTIGWTGTHSTLKQLVPLFPLLEKIHKDHPFRFLLIADVPPEAMPEFVEFRKWKKETEIEDLLEMNIGVMPLYDTDWERGKCGFKALQYQALGIPAVASMVGVNATIVKEHKTGFLCEALPLVEDGKWKKELSSLLQMQEVRSKLGRQARIHVIKNYSVQSQKEVFSSLT